MFPELVSRASSGSPPLPLNSFAARFVKMGGAPLAVKVTPPSWETAQAMNWGTAFDGGYQFGSQFGSGSPKPVTPSLESTQALTTVFPKATSVVSNCVFVTLPASCQGSLTCTLLESC